MKKILLPTDYSAASAKALRYAISLARQSQAELLVVYVEPLPLAGVVAQAFDASEEERESLAVQLAGGGDDAPLSYEVRRLRGDPAHEIIELAAAEKADLIVMATSGRSGLRRMLMGSVAEAVVRGARCPVLTLKEPETGTVQVVGALADRDEAAPDEEGGIDFRSPADSIAAAGRLGAGVLLEQAAAERATDVHLYPVEQGLEVRLRVDGRMQDHCRLSEETGHHVLQQLKVMADLDISDPFHPQEGRAHSAAGLPGYEIRVTTVPVVGGDSAALRLLRRDRLLRPIESLGLSARALKGVQQMLRPAGGEGVVLITGPANSGKTTTAYSMVHALDDGHRNIVTIEDPPEYRIPSFRQLAPSPRHHISMTKGLRTLLRMDPDIILVGEIRDVEAAEIAMRAASSGKFVFTTLHTRDVASTITALRDLKIDNRSLAGNLTGIISQRLVRRLCEHCRRQVPVDEEAATVFAEAGLTSPEHIYSATGCEHCQESGYRERIGVFEAVPPNSDLRQAIEEGVSEDDLRRLIREQGVPTLASDALDKVREGVTSLAEARGMAWATLPLKA